MWPVMAKNLTLKQQKFLELRLEKGLKGAEAYRQAYGSKMPPPLCAKQAYRLLHNPKIKAYLDRAEQVADSRIKTAIARYAVSRERNVAELARMAYANIADYTVAVGPERVINLQAATRDHLAAVQEITVEDYKEGRGENARDVRRTQIKLADKQAAIEKLNRMFGWVIDKSEIGKPRDFAHLTDEEVDAALMAELRARGLTERQARALLESDQSHEKSRSRRLG
jgi:phage terminase small subunit